MIIRARPQYLEAADVLAVLRQPVKGSPEPDDTMFFDSGRSALKFLLETYKDCSGRALVIGLQSFNCTVVCQAVIESGNTACLLDVNIVDYSVALDQLREAEDKLDVLVLTHYQGIPNQRYADIAGYCKDNDILLVEDLAQTEASSINGIEAGSLGDFSFKSYAFDKPLSCWEGGSLSWSRNAEKGLVRKLVASYEGLREEPDKKAVKDLESLRFLLTYSTEGRYTAWVKLFLRVKRLAARPSPGEIEPRRLGARKVNVLTIQRSQYNPQKSVKEIRALESLLSASGCAVHAYPGSQIHWNRYAVVCRTKLPDKVLNEVEVGNYNWPNPLHRVYNQHPKVLKPYTYDVSDFLSQHIINVPIWSGYFQRYDKKRKI